jgi:hypothetical protein
MRSEGCANEDILKATSYVGRFTYPRPQYYAITQWGTRIVIPPLLTNGALRLANRDPGWAIARIGERGGTDLTQTRQNGPDFATTTTF